MIVRLADMKREEDKTKMLTQQSSILIICYDYASVLSPNDFRWRSIAEHWVKQGYEVYVVSAWKPGLQQEEVLNDVRVYRTGGGVTEKIRRSALKTHQPIRVNGMNRRRQTLPALLKWLHDRTWKKIYWPDYACFWFFSALKKANQLMKEFNIKYLVSVSIPFTGHLVGNVLKRKYPETNWVVDIIDPFCFLKSTPVNNYIFYGGLNKIIEKRIFCNAKAVSVLTSPIKKKYAELFPESANKIFVNPNLLPAVEKKKTDATKTPLFNSEKICLVFIGTLNKKVRSAENLLQVFERLLEIKTTKEIELHFFGGMNDCWDQMMRYKRLIDKSIFLHGVVSRQKALHAMHSADLLINIGNNNPYQEPSKLIEYVCAGKSIINLVTIKNDSSEMLLKEYPAVFNILTPITEKNIRQIDDLVKFINSPPLVEEGFIQEWLAPFKIEPIANLYKKLLIR